jgi:hypothetical protein
MKRSRGEADPELSPDAKWEADQERFVMCSICRRRPCQPTNEASCMTKGKNCEWRIYIRQPLDHRDETIDILTKQIAMHVKFLEEKHLLSEFQFLTEVKEELLTDNPAGNP